MMAIFDGIDFKGPVEISDLPEIPGSYIIVTDASGGIKILGAYDGGENIKASAASNPKRQCWEKNRKDTDPVAYYVAENDPKKRERIWRGLMDRRFYEMVCNDPLKDDF